MFVWWCLDGYDYCDDVRAKLFCASREISPQGYAFICLDEQCYLPWERVERIEKGSVYQTSLDTSPWSFFVGLSVLSVRLSIYCSVLFHNEM